MRISVSVVLFLSSSSEFPSVPESLLKKYVVAEQTVGHGNRFSIVWFQYYFNRVYIGKFI